MVRNNNLEMDERLIMSNLHQFRDEKLVIQEVAQIQEEEEERRTRVTFNVIIIKNGAILLVNMLLQ